MTSRQLLAVFFSIPACAWVYAVDADQARTQLYRSGAAQEELMGQGAKIRSDLELVLREMERNGLLETDRSSLERLLRDLESVTEERMGSVLASLKTAAAGVKNAEIREGTVSSYKGMQVVSETLRRLAAEAALLREVEAFPSRLESLMLRQQANQRAYAGRAASASLAATVLPEQAGISETFATLVSEASKLAAGSQVASTQPLQRALAEAQRLRLSGLAADLGSSPSMEDPTFGIRQSQLLAGFSTMLEAFEKSLPVAAQAARLAEDLQKLAEDQRSLAENPNPDQEKANEQQSIMDRTQHASQALAGFDAEKLSEVNKALQKMAQSRAHLADGREGENTAAMEAASTLEALSQQIAEQAHALADGVTPSEAMAQLQELFNETAQLKMDVDRGEGSASTLADRAADLQRSSQSVAPEAAEALGEAQQQMAGNSTAASQSLAEALSDIGQQMRDVSQLAAASERLSQAQGQMAQAEKALSDAAGGQSSSEETQQSLNEANSALAAASAAMGGSPSEAAQATQQSRASVAQASAEMQSGNEEAASQSAASALASARSTKAALEEAQANIADQLGQKIAMTPQAGTDDSNREGGEWDGQSSESQTPFVNTGENLSNIAAARSLAETSNSSAAAREAATVLANERPPSAFQSETEQYLRNLATGR